MFHLTHRCHNRAFLLKFARDRDAYRAKLRQRLREHELWLLDYCLTSNHVTPAGFTASKKRACSFATLPSSRLHTATIL